MGQVLTPAFRTYQETVVANAQALAKGLVDLGYKVVTGGTDNHIVLVDMTSKKLSGSKADLILEEVSISVNKNTVPGDKSAMNPSGIRFGTPPLTTRGIKPEHMPSIVGFIDRALNLAVEIQAVSGPKLVDYKKVLHENSEFGAKIDALRQQVEDFAMQFPLPGREDL